MEGLTLCLLLSCFYQPGNVSVFKWLQVSLGETNLGGTDSTVTPHRKCITKAPTLKVERNSQNGHRTLSRAVFVESLNILVGLFDNPGI